jgi:hypothetical protein
MTKHEKAEIFDRLLWRHVCVTAFRKVVVLVLHTTPVTYFEGDPKSSHRPSC